MVKEGGEGREGRELQHCDGPGNAGLRFTEEAGKCIVKLGD